MKTPESETRLPAEAAPRKAATSKIPDTAPKPERKSIFDTSFAPEGAERRKAWSRFDRKSK
ncbi:MAG: hypothetical protein AB7U46_15010 [Paenirhodobacter sp.]|uniref:hypothetical protein n=1 Tax=Paenirhodobacter sp. TaxID=1965326 RepID=UPI003D0AAAC2